MSLAKTTTLVMFDTKANCNKFYKMTMDDVGSIVCEYGRVGASPQKKYYNGEREFEKTLKSKLKKGYREVELEEEVQSSRTGVSVTRTPKTNVIDVALRQIKYLDDIAKQLVQTIAANNIHQITSNSSVKFDEETGMFTTPLGVIKKDAVERALLLLVKAEGLLSDPDKNEDELYDTSSDYFMIIPNIVSNARLKAYLLFSQKNIDAQREVCGNLLDTLELIAELKEKAAASPDLTPKEIEEEKVFDVTLGHLTDKDVFKRLEDYYESSKKSMHSYKIQQSRIKNIFTVDLANQQAPFAAAAEKIGNVVEVFHGTRLCNLLSIFSRGLLMPKNSPAQQAGAMFGTGIYGAINSSKSAGYCDGGVWSGGGGSTIYMFIADMVMGNAQTPRGATGSSGRPDVGFDSFWAKAGYSGVQNDELIVFSLDRIKLKYLLEIKI